MRKSPLVKRQVHSVIFSPVLSKDSRSHLPEERKMPRNFWTGWILAQSQGTQKITVVQ